MARKSLAQTDVIDESQELTPEQLAVVKSAPHGKPLIKTVSPAIEPVEKTPSIVDELKAKAKAGRKLKKTGVTKRTTLDLPEEIDRKFKKFCKDAGETKQSILEKLVRELVSE